jgi:hypothetical protein
MVRRISRIQRKDPTVFRAKKILLIYRERLQHGHRSGARAISVMESAIFSSAAVSVAARQDLRHSLQ